MTPEYKEHAAKETIMKWLKEANKIKTKQNKSKSKENSSVTKSSKEVEE